MYPSVHFNSLYKSYDMEVIKMHISQWKYKEDLLYIQMEYYLAREKTYICVTFNEAVQPVAYYSE